ncbi:MAG: fumarylacetoacetate hydrolase family protein [Propionibacteriaceae bacterium]|jgi:acylpyruvate hydrolase|nr:fumarylacetoacetate hydrolase family protein [Propionibacteriaceae bacterium]
MRLVRFERGEGVRLGALVADGDAILDLSVAHPGLPKRMEELLAAGPAVWDAVRAAVIRSDALPAALVARAEVRLLAPIPRPRNIYCVGYNYRGHTGAHPEPSFPDVFAKLGNPVIGPEEPIRCPAVSQQVDYEAELGVVIGLPGHAFSEADAPSHIAGYTVFNDVSARDWQARGQQFTLAKSFDTFAPIGPALVTPDEVGTLDDLGITVVHNGKVTLRASTADMVFSVALIVSYISQVVTLASGDIIATGTPQKLPEALADQRWLAEGDTLTITIDRVGSLCNPILAEKGLS